MSCNILRDSETNEIVRVDDENGTESNLFKQAVGYIRNKEKALNIWATSLTDSFKKTGKPATLKNVLNFIRIKATGKDKLTNEDKVHLVNNLMATGMNAEALFDKVSTTFYPEGYFQISRKSLEDSGMYTKAEVNNILTNKAIQNNVKGFTDRLVSFYTNNENTSELDSITNASADEYTEVIDSTKVVGLGKYEQVHPSEVHRVLTERLAGIQDREMFNDVVATLPYEGLISKYNNSELFADSMYHKYSSIRKVPSFTIQNGELTAQTVSAKKLTELKQTARVYQNNSMVTHLIDLLEATDQAFWDTSDDVIMGALYDIERQLIVANLDIIGFNQLYNTNTKEEILQTLYQIEYFSNRLKEGTATEQDLRDFVGMTNEMFEQENENLNSYLDNTSDIKNKTIVTVENPLSEQRMFEDYGLIKVKDNVYQKVNRKDLNLLMGDVLKASRLNSQFANHELFYPTAFNANEEFDETRLRDEKNTAELLKDMKRYLTKRAYNIGQLGETNAPLDYALFTEIYGEAQESSKKDKNMFVGYQGNTQYLAEEFVADFKEAYLHEKLKDSPLFQNVYSNFEINTHGIKLTQKGKENIEYLKQVMPKNKVFNNLQQYAYISKDRYMQRLKPTTEVKPDQSSARDFYMNHPNELDIFKGEYDVKDGMLVIKNTREDFVRTTEGLFENIGQKGNVSIFRNLPIFTDGMYNIVGEVGNYKNTIDQKVENNLLKSEKNATFVAPKNTYTKEESTAIDNEIDGCK